MQASLDAPDIAVLGLYACVLVGMGFYYARKARTAEQFMLAGRGIPAWAAGLAVMSAYTSSISYIATPAKAFESNWHPFIFSLCIIPVAWLACRYAVPYYRGSGLISVYSFLEQRLGQWGRVYAAVSFLLYMVGRIAVILYLVGLLLGTFVPWNVAGIIVVIGLVTVVYTLLGGMEAVIWTDVMQSAIMLGGVVFCAIALSAEVFSGPEPAILAAAREGKFSLGSGNFSLASQQQLSNRTIWVMVIFGVTENLRNLLADQNYVQKYCSVPTERQARRSVWVAMLIYIPLTAVFLYIGTALYAFYQPGDELARAGVTKGDEVFPYFIATRVPVGLRGLIIAAIVAAAMSTVDSALNCSATVLLLDFCKRYFRPGITERGSVLFLRAATVGWGLLGTAFAVLMIRAASALDLWWQISGIFGGGILALFILSLLGVRLRLWQGLLSVAVSIAVVAWASFVRQSFLEQFGWRIRPSLEWAQCELDVVVIGAVGTAVLVGVACALGLCERLLRRK